MFHQANVVPTDIPLGDGSVVKDTTLLEYWYEVVLDKMAFYLNMKGKDPFPARVRSHHFDHVVKYYVAGSPVENIVCPQPSA